MTFFLRLFLLYLLFSACCSCENRSVIPLTKKHSFLDTIIANGAKVTYQFKEKDSLCFMTVSLNQKATRTDRFYYTKNDMRMIPKVMYVGNNELFFICGSGFTYRNVFRYFVSENKLKKTETPFDHLADQATIHSYFPYLKGNHVCVLVQDKEGHFKTVDTQKEVTLGKSSEITVTNDEIWIQQVREKDVKIHFKHLLFKTKSNEKK